MCSDKTERPPSVAVRGLDFAYGASSKHVLRDVSLQLRKGDRCLLVGENGAGKSTLLRLLGGKNMVPRSSIEILGGSPFHDREVEARVSYLGGNWVRDVAFCGYGVAYQGDFPVWSMLKGAAVPDTERLKHLIHVLGVDLEWRMHQVSEGQRRRVQLLLGLVKPFDVLLLDEITTDLDVVARQDLLQFLYEESVQRRVTIVYATHIFDGMQAWATHVAHMASGKMVRFGHVDKFIEALNKDRQQQQGDSTANTQSAAVKSRAGGDSSWLRHSWTNPLVLLISQWIREHQEPTPAAHQERLKELLNEG
ncbi:unnamed protein product [Vitrella brassicaformis CCMP3155]|uniref:ABC transporter domain-containing protein n=2 Tax=Vitrella brassicaformis TaxID=1169539 RepID=A0A0G4FK06_VITBC|nr:unnamed protein product [Vitrella brassicaformis CCMP3155]|eukprot:CEM14107.1 unnamed protein product [Vitrella brassicaformis CCMP3155]